MAKRIPELDGLRALAIIAVFVGHSLKVRMMWMGVDLFFVLSGFLITGILLDAPKTSFKAYIGAFYGRRVRRILPPFVLILIFVSLTFDLKWIHHWYMYFGMMNYLEFFPKEPVTAPLASLWSLAVEEQFYFFWPILVYFVAPKKLPKVLIGLLIMAPLLRGLLTPWAEHQAWNQYHWFFYKSTPFRCDCLAMGSLLAFVWRSHNEKIRKYGYLGLIATALTPPVMLVLSRYSHGFSTVDGSWRGNVITYDIALCAVTGILLWAIGGRYTGILRTAPMRWLARISYTFYLVHEAMLLLAGDHFHRPSTVAIAALVGSLVYAELSWRLVEKPILHGGNRKEARLEVEAAQPHPLPSGE